MASSYLPLLFLAIPRLYNAMATVCLVSRPLLMSAVQARIARSGSWILAQSARGSSQPATAQHIGSKVNAVRLRIYCRLRDALAQIIRYFGTERYGLPYSWLQATHDLRKPLFRPAGIALAAMGLLGGMKKGSGRSAIAPARQSFGFPDDANGAMLAHEPDGHHPRATLADPRWVPPWLW